MWKYYTAGMLFETPATNHSRMVMLSRRAQNILRTRPAMNRINFRFSLIFRIYL